MRLQYLLRVAMGGKSNSGSKGTWLSETQYIGFRVWGLGLRVQGLGLRV